MEEFNRENQELKRRLQETGGKYEGSVRDNQALAGQVRDAQEKLRLSATETSRLSNELNDFKNRLMGLTGENRDLAGQVRDGQEKLRLSASHVQQLVSEIEDFRRRAVVFEGKEKDFARNQQELEKRLNELGLRYETTQRDNQGLAGQVRDAQEKLRLSAT